MTYTADLEPYDYYPADRSALAVGWLDPSRPFTVGSCPADVRERLSELAEHPIRLMRGHHYCQFCESSPPRLLRADIERYAPADVARGNGEIWVASPGGSTFAAPALLPHYIDAHRYRPPEAFIEALRCGGDAPVVHGAAAATARADYSPKGWRPPM